MMKRDECFRALAKRLPDHQIVVAVFNSAFEWIAIRPGPLNYIFAGAMGLGSSHALGLALGMPGRRIIVLDGDGSLLMNLGSLVTVATVAPRNMIHCVVENGTYEANGGYPIPGKNKVDFAGLAKAAGYRHTHVFDDLETFEAQIDDVLKQDGPVFVCLKVVPGGPLKLDYKYMHGADTRKAFKEALGVGAK